MKTFNCDYCNREVDRYVSQNIDPEARVCKWCYPSLAQNGLYRIKVPSPTRAIERLDGLRSIIILLVSGNDRAYRKWRTETTPAVVQKKHHKKPLVEAIIIKQTILRTTPSSDKAKRDMKRIYDSFENMKENYEFRFAQNILTYYCLWTTQPELFFNDYETYIRNTIYEVTRAIHRREQRYSPKVRYMQINTYYVPVIHIETSGNIINNIINLYKAELDKYIAEYISLRDSA